MLNITLWVLQGLMAFHTVTGAVWKLSNSEQSVGSLAAIPHGVWLSLTIIELVCAVGLVLPAFKKNLAFTAPLAAAFIAAEMLAYCGVHMASGDPNSGPMIYWLVVAVLCAVIAIGRLRKPL